MFNRVLETVDVHLLCPTNKANPFFLPWAFVLISLHNMSIVGGGQWRIQRFNKIRQDRTQWRKAACYRLDVNTQWEEETACRLFWVLLFLKSMEEL